jgi:hypothetical protein
MEDGVTWFLRIFGQCTFVLAVFVCSLIAPLIVWLEFHDKITYASIRAAEAREAILEVTRIGEEAERKYRATGKVPSMEDLNCDGLPCKPYTFITGEASVDAWGTIHAKFRMLGVPFTPASQFTAEWDSRSRRTGLEWLVEPWQWKALYLRSVALSVLVLAAPWVVRAAVQRYRQSRIHKS